MFCLGFFCPGSFWQGGFLSRGVCPGVYVRGFFVWGVFCPKQSGYVQIHEKAEKTEGIVDEFCLIFSSIKAVSLQVGRGIAK